MKQDSLSQWKHINEKYTFCLDLAQNEFQTIQKGIEDIPKDKLRFGTIRGL
jgi:hypothetical protein